MNTKHTLKFVCNECDEEFSAVIEYPHGVLNRIIDIINNIFGVGSRKVRDAAFSKLIREVNAHKEADECMREFDFFYMQPVNPPSFLYFGCNLCDWSIMVGDMCDEELEDELFNHINQHNVGKKGQQNAVVSPFLII